MTGSKIGLIGLGNMGSGIAASLAKAGYAVLAWDTDAQARAKATSVPGLVLAATAEIFQTCEFVLFATPTSHQIEACFDAAANRAPQQVICDLTTSDPAYSTQLAQRVQAAGGSYLDIGMSGGGAGAEAGTLTLMVGGEATALARVRPILDCFATNIHAMGASGTGHIAKLIHNQICHAIFMATCEGCHAAQQAGIGLESMLSVINTGNARSYASEVRFPRHIVSGQFDGRSYVATLHKDLTLAVEMMRSLGLTAPYANTTRDLLDTAMAHGLGDKDFTTIYDHFGTLLGDLPADDA